MAQLPSLGRNPLNSLRIVSGCEKQGNDFVKADASFSRGFIGKQVTAADGSIEWAVATGTDAVAGILNSHKTSQFIRSVAEEVVTLDATGVGNLKPYLSAGSVLITSSGTDVTGDFAINTTNGTITDAGRADGEVVVSYRYDTLEPGVDETLGSGKVSIIRGVGELTTLVYDTGAAIAAGDNLYSNNGILSTTDAGSQPVVGTVVQAPTFDNPELRFRINL